MSRYIEILAMQRPFPIGLDEQGREMFSVNFEAQGVGSITRWEEDIIKVLSDSGLVTSSGANINVFVGRGITVPAGSGPFINVIDTGGRSSDETHNGDRYENLSVQVIVRSNSFVATRTRALAIYEELHGLRDVTITS